jgi:Acetylornithine deacetylase/Succinyl-diaminopimelate desuccinylase and related deacylases
MMKKSVIFFTLCVTVVALAIFYSLYVSRGPAGSLDEQMICMLQAYIRIDTTHPKPDYRSALALLKKQAIKDGFLFQEFTLPSGNPMAIISFLGSDVSLPALALNHHMDVVPANNPTEWKSKPFDAAIIDNELIGRGVQDMKGVGMVHYFALKALKDEGFMPRRSIYIFAVPDEEVGGFKGTKEFVASDVFKNLRIGFLIDEGHASGIDRMFDIKVSERKPIQVIIAGKGALAHGSHLQDFNVAHELVQFLQSITDLHQKSQIQAQIIAPGKLLSLNISSLKAGVFKSDGSVALNMIPDAAQATIDIRVPPGMKKIDVLHNLEAQLAGFPHLTYTIAAQADEEPDFVDERTPLYQALARVIKQDGYQVQPHYFEASSDLRFYLDRGIDSVGLTPFTVADNIHGTDESVPLDQLIKARQIMTHFVRDFTA